MFYPVFDLIGILFCNSKIYNIEPSFLHFLHQSFSVHVFAYFLQDHQLLNLISRMPEGAIHSKLIVITWYLFLKTKTRLFIIKMLNNNGTIQKYCFSFSDCRLILSSQTVQTLMKCCIMQHFIWVFTVCQSTHLGVSFLQRVNPYLSVPAFCQICCYRQRVRRQTGRCNSKI